MAASLPLSAAETRGWSSAIQPALRRTTGETPQPGVCTPLSARDVPLFRSWRSLRDGCDLAAEEGVTSEDSEVVDLYAICARASASPAGDLRPPDLFSIAPPCTTDITSGGDSEPTLTGMLKKPRMRLALAGAAGAMLLIGLAIGLSSSSPPPRKPVTASAAAPPPPAETVETPPALLAAPIKLPPPPTTGAPATPAPPPRAVAMRKAPAAPAAAAGPKMTKIRSDGTAVR